MIYIGIDPGVKTGIGYINGENKFAKTMAIHNAINFIVGLSNKDIEAHIRVEDARKRKWFGQRAQEKQQGAGSIKRDCKIWEDFLTQINKNSENKITFEMLHPIKGGTKIEEKMFQKITGIASSTSEHARDAFMLIHNFKKKQSKQDLKSEKLRQD